MDVTNLKASLHGVTCAEVYILTAGGLVRVR